MTRKAFFSAVFLLIGFFLLLGGGAYMVYECVSALFDKGPMDYWPAIPVFLGVLCFRTSHYISNLK